MAIVLVVLLGGGKQNLGIKMSRRWSPFTFCCVFFAPERGEDDAGDLGYNRGWEMRCKNPLTFHCTGCLIGLLIRVYEVMPT